MARKSFTDVIQEQNAKNPAARQPPKRGWIASMLYADRSSKNLPTRQLSIFAPTLFVCMMATTMMMKNKLSVKLEDIDDDTKEKLAAHREKVNDLFREKREADMDEVLLDYEVRLWSNGYQNKPVPKSTDENDFNNEDDDAGDD